MSLFTADEAALARAVSALAHGNPFLPERLDWERGALGSDFVDSGAVWHRVTDVTSVSPNIDRLNRRVEGLVESTRQRLLAGGPGAASEVEKGLYEDLVLYHLYYRHEPDLATLVLDEDRGSGRRIAVWRDFVADLERLGEPLGRALPRHGGAAHLFAIFYQVRRAFHYIFHFILGGSLPAARLRASVWQSIFTHDVRRYRRSLYDRMGDLPTMITGPSGTGKELVARAIALSRYLPFDPERGLFVEEVERLFYPLNLSALSPTLIESELFGHRRGAFTGAVQDRPGWLEVCPTLGSVFLDEVGDVELAIQVKLLRVLETRVFQRLGDTHDRRFAGKIIAATNRDLAEEMGHGRIREDFYYRLCADLVLTPSLHEQLTDTPAALGDLVLFLATRLAGSDEAPALARQVVEWIEQHLGPSYLWPGNVRELEQCVRNVLIRGQYRPAQRRSDARQSLLEGVATTELTLDELSRRYITLAYHHAGSYVETANRLGVDRRTVKARIDASWLERLRGGR